MKEETVLKLLSISEVNDYLRSLVPTLPRPHRMVLSETVASFETDKLMRLFELVRGHKEFTSANDPWGEHDFGKVILDGDSYFFKFDYFDEGLKYFQENGIRVLTLLHSSEY